MSFVFATLILTLAKFPLICRMDVFSFSAERWDFIRVSQCVHVTRSELMKTIKTHFETDRDRKKQRATLTTHNRIVTSERIENSLRSHKNLFPVCATGKSVYAAQSSSHTLPIDHLPIVFPRFFFFFLLCFFGFVSLFHIKCSNDRKISFVSIFSIFSSVLSVRWLRGRLSTETYIIIAQRPQKK